MNLLGKKPLVIIDHGHGLFTEGKKSPAFLNAYGGLSEFHINRVWGKKFLELGVNRSDFDFVTVPAIAEYNGKKIRLNQHLETLQDLPTHTRAKYANWLFDKGGYSRYNCVFVSFHANAWEGATNLKNCDKARGFEVFSANGAKHNLADHFAAAFEQIKNMHQTPNRGAKRADYTVLKETKMPAILLENLFFTSKTDLALMRSAAFQSYCCNLYLDAVHAYFVEVAKFLNQ